MTAKKPSIADEIKNLARGAKQPQEPRKLNKGGRAYKPKGMGNGGKREGAGAKTTREKAQESKIWDHVEAHVNEEVDVQITDPATGKVMRVKRPRVLTVLQKLYNRGMMGDGDPNALNQWLNRAIGLPVQTIEHKGDKNKPIHMVLDV